MVLMTAEWMEVKNKNFLVVGLARSGLAAANFLAGRGARVAVTDTKPPQDVSTRVAALDRSVRLLLGGHPREEFLAADFIVLSPGVPSTLPELRAAAEHGIPVISEVELAFRFLSGRIVGVTGSNGKTTTTSLIGAILNEAGQGAAVAGNIGNPLIGAVQERLSRGDPESLFVVELSSFQLETVDRFRCDIAVVLNITPDHLDRYATLHDYIEAKARIFRNQEKRDLAVLNLDDPVTASLARRTPARLFPFSRGRKLEEGIFIHDHEIRLRWEKEDVPIMPVAEIPLQGGHNLENVLAAAAVAHLLGVDASLIRQAVRHFPGVEHRLEWVRKLDGVDYYNDSKATNVDSARQALRAFDRPLIAILGGKDKGGAFEQLRPDVQERVKRLILIGAAAEKIENALRGTAPVLRASNLPDAVRRAREEAVSGDVVLLAPACASYDMFENFEERGRVFKESVRSLPEGDAAGGARR